MKSSLRPPQDISPVPVPVLPQRRRHRIARSGAGHWGNFSGTHRSSGKSRTRSVRLPHTHTYIQKKVGHRAPSDVTIENIHIQTHVKHTHTHTCTSALFHIRSGCSPFVPAEVSSGAADKCMLIKFIIHFSTSARGQFEQASQLASQPASSSTMGKKCVPPGPHHCPGPGGCFGAVWWVVDWSGPRRDRAIFVALVGLAKGDSGVSGKARFIYIYTRKYTQST